VTQRQKIDSATTMLTKTEENLLPPKLRQKFNQIEEALQTTQ
jgi:hypothetical protein